MRRLCLCACVAVWFLVFLSGCNRQSAPLPNRVVLYCSVDDVYARPIIKRLEEETGLRIDALYDTEATKTAGLATRIRAERDRPRGDVFWSSALLQTLLLEREGLLQEYQSPAARDIPRAFKDAGGAWTGLGVRPRVIVYHKSVKNPPRTLQDLLDPRFRNKICISNVQFGTASDWVAALATRWGVSRTVNYFRALKENGVRVLPGNANIVDKVARGELLAGVTDSDDYLAQRRKGGDILAIDYPAMKATPDSVFIPGSVAMLKNAPNPEAARRLMDALLRAETEILFANRMPGVHVLRATAPHIKHGNAEAAFNGHSLPDDTARWPASWDKVREPLAEILLAD